MEWVRSPINAVRGSYDVVQLVPAGRDGKLQYRIRSLKELADRMVAEDDICSRPFHQVLN